MLTFLKIKTVCWAYYNYYISLKKLHVIIVVVVVVVVVVMGLQPWTFSAFSVS
jgi:hypothetical protein